MTTLLFCTACHPYKYNIALDRSKSNLENLSSTNSSDTILGTELKVIRRSIAYFCIQNQGFDRQIGVLVGFNSFSFVSIRGSKTAQLGVV
jgi:hypothetical protein